MKKKSESKGIVASIVNILIIFLVCVVFPIVIIIIIVTSDIDWRQVITVTAWGGRGTEGTIATSLISMIFLLLVGCVLVTVAVMRLVKKYRHEDKA